jgi:hypothetical protein
LVSVARDGGHGALQSGPTSTDRARAERSSNTASRRGVPT